MLPELFEMRPKQINSEESGSNNSLLNSVELSHAASYHHHLQIPQ
jgi:hypothetical protein